MYKVMVKRIFNQRKHLSKFGLGERITLFLFASIIVTMIMGFIFNQMVEAASSGLKVNVITSGPGKVCLYSENEKLPCKITSGGTIQFQFSEGAVDVGDQFQACISSKDCRLGINGEEKEPETISFVMPPSGSGHN